MFLVLPILFSSFDQLDRHKVHFDTDASRLGAPPAASPAVTAEPAVTRGMTGSAPHFSKLRGEPGQCHVFLS